ncbi:metallophosphoesterase [Campylobacter mucosalis]|uniref:metallophosphoesterase n=1 Tax=Campylobacter mucosalis TaxID=202 RepID=UPI001470355F|nr:metallophosphoesterase [Campylobacter mucosalis]
MGLLRIIVGGFIFSFVLNFYSYKRFISKISFLQSHLKCIKILFLLVSVCEFLFVLQIRFDILNFYFYVAFATLIGFSLFLFSVSVFYDILRNMLKRNKFSQNRRKFLKFCFDITFLILIFSYFFKGIFSALTPPKIKQTNIKIKGLKSPLKIAMITDVHIGDFLQKEFLATLVYQINEQKPDMLVIVGDLIDFNAQKIGDFLDPLKDIKARYGVFYVPGNHEYYHGIDGILEKIEQVGVKILGNKNIELDEINLAGVYDLAGIKFKHLSPNLHKALDGKNDDKPTILLSHQPKFLKTMDISVDLVLCGHTHAGQIFPFGLLVLLDQNYLYGLYQVNDKMQLYVSSGAGFWGPPLRILTQSEIAILNLTGE